MVYMQSSLVRADLIVSNVGFPLFVARTHRECNSVYFYNFLDIKREITRVKVVSSIDGDIFIVYN